MKVKIDGITILDADVKRFIDLQSGLPLSMIKVSYEGEPFRELGEAFKANKVIPFECDILKTNVLVHALKFSKEKRKVEYILQEPAGDVPSDYKHIHTLVGKEKAIVVPKETKDILDMQRFRELPFIRLILKKDIPKDLLES